LSTPIGQTSLGNYIFAGLQTQNWVFVLFGCVAAALLALIVDQLLQLMENGVRMRSRPRLAFGALGIALVIFAAVIPGFSVSRANYVVGGKPFTEQEILVGLIDQRLRAAGFSVARRDGLGSSVIFDALAAGEIDVYVDYSGTIWANQMQRSEIKPRDDVLKEVASWLEERRKIKMLGGLGFENAYALAMPRQRAQALGIRSLADLARFSPRLTIAGDYEFFVRPEWARLRDGYGLAFRDQRQMQSTFMYAAAAAGDVDVISAYTSDGRIAQHDLVVLEDPRQAIPPYDAILLIAPRRAADTGLIEALRPLVDTIDIDLIREANLRAATNSSPEAVAGWLWEEILRRKQGRR
jgi:osmoprotectant transport system permease protein